MNYSTYRISLDIHKPDSNVVLNAKRGDTNRKIFISLTDGSVPYHISEECYAVFTATKPDGKIVYNECTIEDCVIVYKFTDQTVAAEGLMDCEIKLYGADNELITSPRFIIMVHGTVYDEGDEVESSDEFSALTKLVTDAQQAIDDANQAAEDANDAVKSINDIMLPGKIVKTVNGVAPDENGNVQIEVGSGSGGEVFVPKAQVTQTANGATITITDQHGTSEATVNHGKDGEPGVYILAEGENIADAPADADVVIDPNGETDEDGRVEVPDSSQNGDKLTDGSVFYNHISEITYEGEPTEDEIVPDEPEETIVNLFDKDTMVLNGYFNSNTGVFTTHSIARCAYVPVEVGKLYSLSAVIDGTPKAIQNAAYGIYWFDSNKNVMYRVSNGMYFQKYTDGNWAGSSDAIFRADDNNIGKTIGIPEGVAYIGIGLKNTAAATAELTDYYMFEEGTACHDYVPFSSGDDTPTEAPDVSTQGNLAGCEITGLFGATLADTYARRNISALAAKVEGMTGLSDDTIIDSGLRKFGYAIEPALDDIPTVYANGDSFADMTKDKNEVQMSFRYISKTKVFGGWMKIKWQGNLSLNFSKKNFTVKLYGDKTMKHKLKVDLRGWGEQNKFVWKANYVDRSHARNIVSARLWSDMVASRPTYDARLMYSPNHGAIDGFPFRLYVNGEYYGLMTWNIPKDGWMAEMTEDNKNHCILCAEINNKNGTSSCDFAADFNSSAWSVEFPDEISNGLKYSFNDIIACVVNDTDEDFKSNINNHLDLYSALDYYLFFYLNGGGDSLGKNILLFTYDGVKWNLSAYDMDGVWGRTYNGHTFSATTACPEGYENTNSLLWKRIEACFGQELRDRYFELRETILSKEYIMAKFEQFENQIPEDMFTEDQTKNGMIGVSGSAFLTELGAWLDARFAYVDAEMEAMATTE